MATITPYVDRENVLSNRKNEFAMRPLNDMKQTPVANPFTSASRKALGDVANKTGSIKRASNKVDKNRPGSPMKPPVLPKLYMEKNAFSERKRSSDEEAPPIDVMPTYNDDLPDDYEDIWPKADRLSMDQLDQLIKWQPCGNSLSELSSEDETYLEESEDIDPMKFFAAIECVPVVESKEMLSFLDDEPLFEFTPLDDDF